MYILIAVVVIFMFVFALLFIRGVGNLKTPQERAEEDEIQAKYLRNKYLK